MWILYERLELGEMFAVRVGPLGVGVGVSASVHGGGDNAHF
jgi:hypothetical protein